MMGIFGWSLPPGCGTLPGEESCPTCITQYVKHKPDDIDDVWWDEDGCFSITFHYTVPADYPFVPCPERHCHLGVIFIDGVPTDKVCPVCNGNGEVRAANPVPEHKETDSAGIPGLVCEWDDDLTDEENFRRAAEVYDNHVSQPK